jgi:hypothetical protein
MAESAGDPKIAFSKGLEFAIRGWREDGGMKREIGMGTLLAAAGLWFGYQALLLPSDQLSDGNPAFLILKIASGSFLFLGLALSASALFLRREPRSPFRSQPLNLMTIALLALLFFLSFPSTQRSPIFLFFPLLIFCGVQGTWRGITTPTLVLALLAWVFYEVFRITPTSH